MRKSKLTVTLGAVLLLAILGGSSYAQSDNFTNRELCLADCRYSYSPLRPGFGQYRNLAPGQAYAYCVQRCENRFWRDVERDVEEE